MADPRLLGSRRKATRPPASPAPGRGDSSRRRPAHRGPGPARRSGRRLSSARRRSRTPGLSDHGPTSRRAARVALARPSLLRRAGGRARCAARPRACHPGPRAASRPLTRSRIGRPGSPPPTSISSDRDPLGSPATTPSMTRAPTTAGLGAGPGPPSPPRGPRAPREADSPVTTVHDLETAPNVSRNPSGSCARHCTSTGTPSRAKNPTHCANLRIIVASRNSTKWPS